MEEKSRKNPWLGLESYQEGEILYGRDDDIRDLTQSVLNDTDTLLYGKSGIGKSSILNAGVIPAARRYGYLPVLIRLSHKGGFSYLHQIKEAIAHATIPIPTDENGNLVTLSQEEQTAREQELALRIREVVACKDKDKETLYEYFHRHTFHDKDGERINLLIIFDQFEEIFTLQKDSATKKRFFAELANFLNDIMPDELQADVIMQSDSQAEVTIFDADNIDDLLDDLILTSGNDIPEYVTDNTIHLVFTIREDFLSEFEYYSTTIPSLKQNRYGLRPINEEQASQIILRPVPGLISESVARLIIENVTGRDDFRLDGVPEIEVDSAVLSLYLNRLYDAKEGDVITAELVEQKGGEIISNFYNDAISVISESAVEYLEDRLLNGQGRRDNITVYDAIHEGNVTEKELDILCNKKKILRQFNYAGDLRIEYVHDILCPVVKAHKDERVLLKQQEAERERQEAEHEALVRRQKEELEKVEREARRQRKKIRMRLNVSLFLLLAGIVTWTIWFFFNRMTFKESYADFTVRYGWPEGIGKKLSDSEKGQMPVYYQLIRYGYNKKNTRVNVLNSQKQPTRNKFDESPLVGLYETDGTDEQAKEFAILQRQTAYWVYTPDNNNNVLWEAVALTLAEKAGLKVQKWQLTDVLGKKVLILKRFDRERNRRIPFISAMSMLNANDGESGDYSYLDIAEIIRTKGVNITEDLKELWSRILFSVLISNTDDHLRNHGFLKLEPNGWSLSPLYDVNPSTDKTSNLQLNINETSSTTSVDLALSVAKYFGLGS